METARESGRARMAIRRLAVVGLAQGVVLVLASLAAAVSVVAVVDLAQLQSCTIRVPLVALPAASPPEDLVAALQDACAACEVEVVGGELVAVGGRSELSPDLVFAAAEAHGYEWTVFSYETHWQVERLLHAAVSSDMLAFMLLPMPLLLFAGGWWLRVRHGLERFRVERPSSRRLLRIVGIGLGSGLLLVAGVALVDRLMAQLGLPIVEQPWVVALAQGGGVPRIWLLLTAVVAAPIGEEVFFRGWMLPYLERLGRPVAVVVSASSFAVMHFYPPALVLYFLFGLGLGFLYLRTRSLLAPILAHAVNNAVAVAVLFAGSGPMAFPAGRRSGLQSGGNAAASAPRPSGAP